MSRAKLHTVRFTVEGTGPLPLDMLRYDASYPATEHDSARAFDDHFGRPRAVELEHRSERRDWTPTTARWQSFGWRVVEPGT